MPAIIIGGDDLARAGCASIVEPIQDVVKLNAAGDHAELQSVVREQKPDWIIILGWNADVSNIVKAAESAADVRPNFALVYSPSMNSDHLHVIQDAFALNFKVVLSSSSDLAVLKTVLTGDHSDVIYVSTDVIESMMPFKQTISGNTIPSQEVNRVIQERSELLAHIAQGFSNKEIAREFNVTEDHVKSRIRQTMRSLGLNKRTQLATIYLQRMNSKESTMNDKRESPAARSDNGRLSSTLFGDRI